MFDQLGGRDVLDLLDDPTTLTAHPTATNEEHLHGCFELILGHRDDVGVGRIGKHYCLLFHRSP